MRRQLFASLLPIWVLASAGCNGDSDPIPPTDGGPPADTLVVKADTGAGETGTPDADAGTPPLVWSSVSAGGAHTCAVRSDDTAWCWGSNSNGQLGNGTATSSAAPVQVKGLVDVTQVAADWVHTCAATKLGIAHCWGENDGMQLGDPKAETSYPSCTSGGCTEPVKVVNITNVGAVGTGNRHSCAVLGDGSAWCWGFNELGQLGDGKMPNDSASPSQVSGLQGAAIISGSPWHTCGVTTDGKAYCWGDNTDGNLGVDESTVFESATPILVPQVVNAASISAGDVHTCARTKGGKVLCFGANSAGQLGNGTTQGGHTPTEVQGPSGVSSVSTTVDHSCAVDGQGDVWCWGSNGTDSDSDGVPEAVNGKLGQPETVKNQLKPVQVSGVAGAAAVTTGDDHTCAITGSGEIWCWGSNAEGQLGASGAGNLSAKPVQVPVPTQ